MLFVQGIFRDFKALSDLALDPAYLDMLYQRDQGKGGERYRKGGCDGHGLVLLPDSPSTVRAVFIKCRV